MLLNFIKDKFTSVEWILNPFKFFLFGLLSYPLGRFLIRRKLFLPLLKSVFFSKKYSDFLSKRDYVLVFNFDNPLTKVVCEELAKAKLNVILIGSNYSDMSTFGTIMKKLHKIDLIMIDKRMDSASIINEVFDINRKLETFKMGMVIFISDIIENGTALLSEEVQNDAKTYNVNLLFAVQFLRWYRLKSHVRPSLPVININVNSKSNQLIDFSVNSKTEFLRNQGFTYLNVNLSLSGSQKLKNAEDIIRKNFQRFPNFLGLKEEIVLTR